MERIKKIKKFFEMNKIPNKRAYIAAIKWDMDIIVSTQQRTIKEETVIATAIYATLFNTEHRVTARQLAKFFKIDKSTILKCTKRNSRS